MLHLHSNPQHCHTVRYIYADNKKRGGAYCCVSRATMVTRTRHAMGHTLTFIFHSQLHTAVGKAANRRMGVTAIQIAADNLV